MSKSSDDEADGCLDLIDSFLNKNNIRHSQGNDSLNEINNSSDGNNNIRRHNHVETLLETVLDNDMRRTLKCIRLAQKLTFEEKVVILNAIAAFPKLQRLEIDLMLLPRRYLLLPISALTNVISGGAGCRAGTKSSSCLTTLKLNYAVLSGTKRDFENLANAIASHPSLIEVQFRFLSMEDPTITLDPLFRALSQVKTLEKVVVDMKYNHPNGDNENNINNSNAESPWIRDASSLESFCASKRLKSLTLGRIQLSHPLVAAMTKSFERSPALKKLKLCNCHMMEGSASFFANLLQVNTSIERFIIDGYCINVRDDDIIAMARALEKNKSTKLKELEISIPPESNSNDEEEDNNIENSNNNNDSRLFQYSDGAYLALVQMLEHNFTLQSVLTDTRTLIHDDLIRTKMNFYLKLNQAGRLNLLCNENAQTAPKDWFKALNFVKHDLDCLYYFISTNPSICETYFQNNVDDLTAHAQSHLQKVANANGCEQNGMHTRTDDDTKKRKLVKEALRELMKTLLRETATAAKTKQVDEWFSAVTNVRDDLVCLFYFIAKNPAIICPYIYDDHQNPNDFKLAVRQLADAIYKETGTASVLSSHIRQHMHHCRMKPPGSRPCPHDGSSAGDGHDMEIDDDDDHVVRTVRSEDSDDDSGDGMQDYGDVSHNMDDYDCEDDKKNSYYKRKLVNYAVRQILKTLAKATVSDNDDFDYNYDYYDDISQFLDDDDKWAYRQAGEAYRKAGKALLVNNPFMNVRRFYVKMIFDMIDCVNTNIKYLREGILA